MITDAEMTFWIMCGVLALLTACAIPFINNYLEQKRVERMFKHYDFEEYHDDMEDC